MKKRLEKLLEKINDKKTTRDDIAKEYSKILPTNYLCHDEWAILNKAVKSRWSLSALKYIKKKAWTGLWGSKCPKMLKWDDKEQKCGSN